MEETLFYITWCDRCNALGLTDYLGDRPSGCAVCQECGTETVTRRITSEDLGEFMISTKVQLWKLFADMARSF